jgi:PDZ domain-containing protein
MKFFRSILMGAIIVALLVAIKTPYLILVPGTAEDVLGMIYFQGKPLHPTGHLYLTTVYVSRADLLLYLYGLLDPNAKLVKMQGVSQKEENQIETMMMQESLLSAEEVALKKAGYPVKLQGTGVKILQVLKQSLAQGILKSGEVILAINHHAVYFVHDLISYLNTQKPGFLATLLVEDGGVKKIVQVKTIPAPNGKGARLGILVASNGLKLESPVKIKIHVQDIEGSSAGLMFALGTYDLLKGGNLLHGLSVAGTGTIDVQGNVGPIEGIRQKMIAAKKAGAKYFFCPVENYSEAEKNEEGLVVAPVKNFDEALADLKKW